MDKGAKRYKHIQPQKTIRQIDVSHDMIFADTKHHCDATHFLRIAALLANAADVS